MEHEPKKSEPRPYTPPVGARRYGEVYGQSDADLNEGLAVEEVAGFADRPPLGDNRPFRLVRLKQ